MTVWHHRLEQLERELVRLRRRVDQLEHVEAIDIPACTEEAARFCRCATPAAGWLFPPEAGLDHDDPTP